MNDEQRLKEKLRAIEALFAGTTIPGEQQAAARARDRIIARIAEVRSENLVEWRFTLDHYRRYLFLALTRRYGLEPYRYVGQRRTTLVIRAPEQFVKEIFLPEYERMVEVLEDHLMALTKQLVSEALESDAEEPEERVAGFLPSRTDK